MTRVVEDLAALAGEAVTEVTAETRPGDADRSRLLVGTEAVLHHVEVADVVAFLDFDQELLAPRYRAAEQAMTLLVRAARIVGGRRDGGRVLLQTRLPDDVVCRAAVVGDPSVMSEHVDRVRQELGLPPHRALAEVGGPAAAAFVERLQAAFSGDREGGPGDPAGGPADVIGATGGAGTGIMVRGPHDGRWRIDAPDHATLCDALAAVDRPLGRLRLAVDPPRL